ncbi:MAG: hypothetical protein QME58_01260 [Bacteroidota bacterium]|nr:hypothetical protein [Bacteroidota bacterium]
MYKQRICHRYSQAFTISEARAVYDILGGATIQTWLQKLGKTHLLNKVIRYK